MATVTSLTAERMLAIEAASVVDGEVVGDDLILTRQDGSQINAGDIRGPQGVAGPIGVDLTVVSERAVLEVGVPNQIRAGRQLSATDFTSMGLAAPIGLWNLSNLNDSSGNGRNLVNKGSVTFAQGINGVASTAAQFNYSATQALYISDIGASDPFRIKTGTIGCWFRSTRRGNNQSLVSKRGINAGDWGWQLAVNTANVPYLGSGYNSGLNYTFVYGSADVCDGKWHFIVGIHDGVSIRVYVDGILNGFGYASDTIHTTVTSALNIGGFGANGAVDAYEPVSGYIDEAFVTAEVLSDDQVRNLYCAKISHALGSVPKTAGVSIRRQKRGAALLSGDFSAQPLRLYNFSAGSLSDEGSNDVGLTAVNAINSVPGVDGSLGNAYKLSNALDSHFYATDAGLPSAFGSRSYGLWFAQSTAGANQALISWGAGSGTSSHALYIDVNGHLKARTPSGAGIDIVGPHIANGDWHFAVVVEDNSASDGLKRKLYVDGQLVAVGADLASITLSGATRFRIGHWADGTGDAGNVFDGSVDSVFVCGYAMSADEISTLFAKGSQSLGVSPKNAGDHIEAMTSTDLLCVFDTIRSVDQVDLVVA